MKKKTIWEQSLQNWFAVMLVGMIVTILFLYFSQGMSGNDYWWHVKTGEWIVSHGRVPQTDIYSWVGRQKEILWTPHEWLSEVCFYEIRGAAGDEGVYLFCAAGAVGLNLCMLWVNRKRLLDNCIFTLFFSAFFAAVSGILCYGRPHFFTFFLLFAELHCLYTYLEYPKSNCIYKLPILGLLWGNLHAGSAPLSYLLPALLFVSGIWDIRLGRLCSRKFDKKELGKLAFFTLWSAMCICINPLGGKALTYPYTQVGQALQMQIIAEWGAPDIKQTGQLILYFFPVFLTIIGIFLTKKDVRLFDVLIMGLFGYLFLRSKRFIILYEIGAGFWVFRYMLPVKVKEKNGGLEKGLAVMAMTALIGAVCAASVMVGRTCMSGSCISMELSQEMLEFVKQEKPQRLFNDYDYGGDLIFNDISVFFDGRADVYSDVGILSDGVSLLFLQKVNLEETIDRPGQENQVVSQNFVTDMLEKYDFDGFLVRDTRPLYEFLRSCQHEYELLYETGGAAYFRRIKGEDVTKK